MEPISELQEKAMLIMKEHRWSDAIQVLEEDVRIHPDDPWSPMYLGSCYYELRDYEIALFWFKQAHQIAPGLSTPIGLQGDALHCLGRVDEARERYLYALQMDPDDELVNENWKRFCKLEKG